MSSSTVAVVGGSSHVQGAGNTGQELHAMMAAEPMVVEEDTTMTELETDLASYQNMEDASPGTIIFSPQDLRPLANKRNSPRPPVQGIMPIHRQGIGSKSNVAMTAAERKAERIAAELDKLKDTDGPVGCQFCGKEMLTAKTLVQHMSIHAEYKPFQCPHCPKSFTRKVQLQGHLVIHGIEKQFECPVCHQRFSRRDCVKVHMRIHDKTKCAFCEVCHKSFLTIGALNIHLRIHRGEKPFKCHLCGKCFTQKNHLITHIKRHTNVQDVHFAKKLGPRMFQCEHCTRSFIRLSDYERHVQWNHGAVADVNNMPGSNGAGLGSVANSAKGKNPVKAPRDVIMERSKCVRKRKEPIVMCTSATQTDEGGGHVIIPRQYKQQFDMEQKQQNSAQVSEPSSTPHHIDEDTYDPDAYDEGMDRNYSSDEDELSDENQTAPRIFSIEASTGVSTDPARDAAFDAIINSSSDTSPLKSKGGHQMEGEHILPDSLDAEQPNERVFIIQNETDSYEPTVTAGDSVMKPSFSTSIDINVAPVSTTTFSSVTPKQSQQKQPLKANQGQKSGMDLNRHLGSDNFMQMVQSSYQNMSHGEIVSASQNPGVLGSNGQSSGLQSTAMNPPLIYRGKRGRPKTKRVCMKGAAQLRLIRKTMMNYISDVEESKSAEKALEKKRLEAEGSSVVGVVVQGTETEDDGDDDDVQTENADDPLSVMEQQVLMGVSESEAETPRKSLKRRATIKHGKDFLCASKSCRLCRPTVKLSAEGTTVIAGYKQVPPGTVLKAVVKPAAQKPIKKEKILSELAEGGSQKIVEIVNLLNYGVKSLDELKLSPRSEVNYHVSNQNIKYSSIVYNSGGSDTVNRNSSNFPITGKTLLSDGSSGENELQYLTTTSTAESIVSPHVDVQSFCIPTYSCKLCGREFRFEGKLHRHIESVHQKKSIFTSDVKPGRGAKIHFTSYDNLAIEPLAYSMQSNIIVPNNMPNMTVHEKVSAVSDDVDDEASSVVSDEPAAAVSKNPEIEALRSEWDDGDAESDEDNPEVRPTVTKPQPIFNSVSEKQRQVAQQQRQQAMSQPSAISTQNQHLVIVTRSIQPMVTTVTDVYSGGVVVNMNKLSGLLPRIEPTVEPDKITSELSKLDEPTKIQSLEDKSLDSKCQKLLLKLFDQNLLVECGLSTDHVSAVLGRILQHYGVKMIEDYGQGQYEVLKYNLWRLMEWKVTIEQMEEFYCENKTVEEMMDDIMNERVPLVPHAILTQAMEQEQAMQERRQQQVEEMVVANMDTDHRIVVEQQVEGEHVVVQGTEQMIIDHTNGQHLVVESVDQSTGQQIVLQGGNIVTTVTGGMQQTEQIILQQPGQVSTETAMLVQQVMDSHHLTGVTQVVLAHDVSPEMLQGAHIVTIDPATGQVISQVSADQMVLTTAPDGTTTLVNNAQGVVGSVVTPTISVTQEQMMMLQQQQYTQHSSSAS